MKRIALPLFLFAILILGVLGYLSLDKSPVPGGGTVAGNVPPSSGEPADSKAERPAVEEKADEKGAQASQEGNSAGWTPSFDVVRVEKNGETLIAGQGAPNGRILIESNGKIVAETRADETGAFVAILTEPFRGENNAVVIRSIDEKGNEIVSEQVVAIGVPEKGEALVALVEPGKAVSILQKPSETAESASVPPSATGQAPDATPPDVPSAPTETAIAEAEPTPPATTTQSAALAKPEATPAEVALAATDPAAADGGSAGAAPEPAAPEAVAPEPASPPVALGQNGVETGADETRRIARLVKPDDQLTPPDGVVTSEGQAAAPVTDTTGAGNADAASLLPTASPTDAASPPSAASANAAATPKVSVEAVEVDGDKLFIAGAVAAGATVRVYVDGKAVGDVKAGENGRWLFDESNNLASGDHTIRADVLDPASGAVTARAEVPFVVEERALADIPAATGGTIIIRRNDNLWTIAKRLYGDGLRYTAIYNQNRDQIRNPDLIYPGQTFTLPTEETVKNDAN